MKPSHIPNLITFCRLLLIVPLSMSLALENYRYAFYLFTVAGISDGIDGFLARRYQWHSRLGSIIDPIADKLLLLFTLLILVYTRQLPSALLMIIALRDCWVIAGALAYHYWIGPYEMAPRLLSKLNTLLQILLVMVLLIHLSFVSLSAEFINGLIYVIAIVCLISGLDYTWVWGRRAWFARRRKFSLAFLMKAKNE